MKPTKLSKLKRGAKIGLTKGRTFRKFFRNEAWSMTTVGGILRSDEDAEEYVTWILLAAGLEKAVKFLQYSSNVGDGVPGAHVEIIFPGGYKTRTVVAHHHIRSI